MKILSSVVVLFATWGVCAQISLSALNTAVSENFNSLATSGTSSTLPAGWVFTESGSSANLTYTSGTGSGNTGDTYSFGASSSTERALGSLRSGSLNSVYGSSYTNNTGASIIALEISYTGEQWRLGATGRIDQLDFQYSTDATSVTSGTWIDFNSLDFIAPVNSGTVGALNGNVSPNRTSLNAIITGLSISAGSTIWIRWTDIDASGSDDGLGIDDFSLIPRGNSITTGSVLTSPFSVLCSSGTSGTVSFSSVGTFNPGNTFTAQLSNASGSFAAPLNIGSLDSTSSVGTNITNTISFTIPAGTPSGTGYRIRVISTSPSVTGSSSTAFTINLTDGPCNFTAPHITSVIINSCNPTCPEGHNELVFGTTGDYSVTVNTSNFDILYGSTYPLINYTDVLTTNPTTTASINTAAGCSGNFVEGTGATMPPNSSFILAPNQLCVEALQWSGLCGSGPIYIIYQNDASWNLNGTFKNGNTGGLRYFNSTIQTTSGETFSIDYNYNSTSLQTGAAGDGDYVLFGPDGGAATYGDNDCILTPVLLPSGLSDFQGFYTNKTTELMWQTFSEQNNAYFTVLHSTNGFHFDPIGQVTGAGNSVNQRDYRLTHERPHPGINYYQLRTTDYDGTTYNKGTIAVEAAFNYSYYNSVTMSIELAYSSDVEIYTLDGKLVKVAYESLSIPFTSSGLFLIVDRKSGLTERLLIP